MHACLYVLHEQFDDVDDLLRPYDEDNEEYFEFDYDPDYCYPIDEITQDEAEENGMVCDETGEYYGHYYNTQGKYDYYDIGGRWEDILPLKDGEYTNSAKISDIDIDNVEPPAHYITPDGIWHDNGMMILKPADEDQVIEFRNYLRTLHPNTMITVVDIHY